MKSNPRDCWATPPGLVAAVSDYMGLPPAIDLCASPENAKAVKWFTAEDDVTTQDPSQVAGMFKKGSWAWCNPPYSRGNVSRIAAWCARLSRLMPVVMLLPASQSDGWWREHIAPNAKVLFVPDRRVRFIPPPGVTGSSNSGQNLGVLLSPSEGDCIVKRLKWD